MSTNKASNTAGMTLEQRLQKANFSVIQHIKHCAISGVVMYGKTHIIDDPQITAYTDGRDIKYGRPFIEGLSMEELRFVVLHENYHKAFRHMTTWKSLWKQSPQLANMACDFVINLALHDLDAGEGFIKLTPGVCMDEKYRGMDAGAVFRDLMKNAQKQKGGGGKGHDQHGWEDANQMSQEEQQAVAAEIDRALRQGQVLAGKRAGGMDRALGELLEPQIDWREVLREFVTSICSGRDMSTWRKVNKRHVGRGVYMPGSYSEAVGRIVIGVDTSGSIGDAELAEFMAEVVGVCKAVSPEVVDLLYWDTAVAGHEKYGVTELDQIPSSTKPKGGGGTDVECVSNYIREKDLKPECVIILSDGYLGGGWGEWGGVPVLWCIAGNKVIAPVGKTVHIN